MKAARDLSLLAEAVRAGAGFSPLFRWLRANHDAFAELVDGARPNWARIAAAFAEMGIAQPDGTPINAATARHTWWRCRKDVAARRAKRRPSPVMVVAPMIKAPLVSMPAADPLAELRRQMAERSGRKSDG